MARRRALHCGKWLNRGDLLRALFAADPANLGNTLIVSALGDTKVVGMNERHAGEPMNKAQTLLALTLAAAALAGCNTIQGVGQDLEAAGDAISQEADEEGAS